MNTERLKYIRTKKAWVYKKAILENAAQKRIGWLLKEYNRGIPCRIEDINENKVLVTVKSREWQLNLRVWVPFIAVNIEHKLFKQSIPLLLLLQRDIVDLNNFWQLLKKQEAEYLREEKIDYA